MAALTATDITYSLVTGQVRNPRIENGIRYVNMVLTVATVGTYPSGGIPLATSAAKWNMKRNVERSITVYDPASGNTLIPKYSATGHAIRLYQQQGLSSGTVGNLIELATTATAGTGGTLILYVTARGW